MNLHPIDISIIVGYLILCLIIGFAKYGKIRNIRDYTLGYRPFPTSVLIATTFATIIGADSVIGEISKVYEIGFILIIPLVLVSPISWFLVAKLFAPNLNEFHKLKFMSLSDIMEHWYGNTSKWTTTILSLLVTMGVTTASTIAIGYLLHYFVNIPEDFGIIIGLVIVTAYSAFGGIISVSFTDVFQFLIFFVALPIACGIGYQKAGNVEAIIASLPTSHTQISSHNIPLFLSLILYSIIPYTGIPIIQRALMAKNAKQFTDTFIGVGILLVPILAITCFIGLLIYKINPTLDSNIALYYFIDHFLSPGIKGLLIAGLLAIIMSTQDSFLNTTSSLISRSICKEIWPSLTDKQELLIARFACILISALSMLILSSKKGIMDVQWAIDSFWDPLVSIPLIAGLLGCRMYNKTFKLLVILSLTTTIGTRMITGEFDTRSLVAGAVTSILVLYFGHRKYKKDNPNLFPPKSKKTFMEIFFEAARKNNFSTNSIYIVGTVMGLNFIAGTLFLNLSHYTFLNIAFAITSTIFIALLLNELWGYKVRNYVSFFWRFGLIFGLLFIPSYIMFVTNFNALWVCNLVLSVVLFFTLTNPTIGSLLSVIVIPLGFIVSIFVPYTYNELASKKFPIAFCVASIVSIIMKLYHSKFVAREVLQQLETKVGERTSELKKALSVKQEFLSKVNHEVRTPLQGILGISSGLASNWDTLSEERKLKYANLISQSGNRLMEYTSNILDLASIQKNKFSLEIKPNIDISKIAEDAITNARSLILAKNKDLKISLKLDTKKIPLIECDPIRIAQIFNNLLHNAVVYSEKGEIEFKIKSDDKGIIVSISDSGVGIPDSEKMSIFSPFFEGSRTKTSAQGKGLGLAISQELASLHNTHIKVFDNKPKGSIFIINLPYKQPNAKNSLEIQENKPRILLIDNDTVYSQSLELIINSLGHKTAIMDNGYKGIDYVEKNYNTIDLIVLDMLMPGINGLAVLEYLRNNRPYRDISVFMQSDLPQDHEDMIKARSLGADTSSFAKPYDKNSIKSTLTSLLNKS